MATWIAHLRLAQNLLDYGFQVALEPFLVGNIAPDGGIATANGWNPVKSVTHFYDENEYIQPEVFASKWLASDLVSDEVRSFMLGYYVHLVADVEWSAQIWQPFSRQAHWADGLAKDPEFVWTIKRDWYNLDFLYLDQHQSWSLYDAFSKVNTVPDYLDFFPQGALTQAVRKVITYYSNSDRLAEAQQHDYRYLTAGDIDSYVECTTTTLIELFKGKEVACPIPRPLSAYGIRLDA